jgi:hypothetical protein
MEKQCRGTTKKGLRCLKPARPGLKYCRYHIGNDEHLIELVSAMTISKPVKIKTSGYIYMYTLDVSHNNAHVYDHDKQKYRALHHSKSGFFKKIAESLGSPPPETHSVSGHMRRTLLVKIGYTTKDPVKRLQEWKTKCKHPVILLSPPSPSSSRVRLDPEAGDRFDQSKLGWPTVQVRAVESAIHTELRGLFGNGHVECEGCSGRHNEWFLIPAGKMRVVYDTINYWIALYSGGTEVL